MVIESCTSLLLRNLDHLSSQHDLVDVVSRAALGVAPSTYQSSSSPASSPTRCKHVSSHKAYLPRLERAISYPVHILLESCPRHYGDSGCFMNLRKGVIGRCFKASSRDWAIVALEAQDL
jgi:hypothetical protein